MAIVSSYRIFSPVRLIIGKPIYLEKFYDKKLTMEHHREISNSLMGRVFEVLQEAGKDT